MFILSKLVKDLLAHRNLLFYMTKAEFKAKTARTLLGTVWWFLDPLFYMGIYYLLVHIILQRGGPGYPAFLFAALIPMKWTTSSLSDSTTALVSNASIIRQIYIPKIVFVAFRMQVNISRFVISLVILFAFLLLMGVRITYHAFFLIPVIMVHAVMLLAVMSMLSHIGVYFRDIKNMMQYFSRALIYISPVLYAIDSVPGNLSKLLYLNPMTTLLTSYRNVLLYQDFPQWRGLIILFFLSIVVLYIGLKLLFKYDKEYAKVI